MWESWQKEVLFAFEGCWVLGRDTPLVAWSKSWDGDDFICLFAYTSCLIIPQMLALAVSIHSAALVIMHFAHRPRLLASKSPTVCMFTTS